MGKFWSLIGGSSKKFTYPPQLATDGNFLSISLD